MTSLVPAKPEHGETQLAVVCHAGLTLKSGARTGVVTLVQRFGSALNLNVHFHILFLDGANQFPHDRCQTTSSVTHRCRWAWMEILRPLVAKDRLRTRFSSFAHLSRE